MVSFRFWFRLNAWCNFFTAGCNDQIFLLKPEKILVQILAVVLKKNVKKNFTPTHSKSEKVTSVTD